MNWLKKLFGGTEVSQKAASAQTTPQQKAPPQNPSPVSVAPVMPSQPSGQNVRVMMEDGRIKELKAPQTASELADFLGNVLKS